MEQISISSVDVSICESKSDQFHDKENSQKYRKSF